MARRKIHLADGIARVVYIETEATKGATLGTNLYLPSGALATPTNLAAYLGLSGSSGGSSATQHSQLQGLDGNDHPQYALAASLEAVAFSGEYGDLTGTPTIPSDLDDLADVNVYGAADGEVLTYDAYLGLWVPGEGGGGSGGTLVTDGVLHVQDQKASGTAGGTPTAGAWNTRVLNTVVVNTISGASLASNQITLPAGTYVIYASAPAHQGESNKTVLYNVTDGTYVLHGQSVRSRATSSTDGTASSKVHGQFTLSGTKTLELRHWFGNSLATTGLGQASSSGQVEVYADVLIQRMNTMTVGLKYAASDLAKTSDTTLAADTALDVTLAANTRYRVEYDIEIDSSATPDLKWDLAFGGTTTSVIIRATNINPTTASLASGASFTTFAAWAASAFGVQRTHTVTGTDTVMLNIVVKVDVGASGGTLSFRWAQNTSSGTAVTRRRNSCVRVETA